MVGEYLRKKQIREINRLIGLDVYSTRAEAERALVEIGLKTVLEENHLEPLKVGA